MAQFHETIMGRQFYESTVPSIAKSLEAIASEMKSAESKTTEKELHYKKLLSSIVEKVSVNLTLPEQVEELRRFGFTTEDLKEFGYSDENILGKEDNVESDLKSELKPVL